ncbi:MAG: type II toxin-antitoxin system VapC family toxin [Candidatus Thorarchaeota archaeon]
MLLADTEVLFALAPRDSHHPQALAILETRSDIVVPDVSILEFSMVLKARGVVVPDVRMAILAVRKILRQYGVQERNTIGTEMLALSASIEERYHLSYFDSPVAGAAVCLKADVLSDDRAFDRVPKIKRVPLSG